jgi:hypothetical protein
MLLRRSFVFSALCVRKSHNQCATIHYSDHTEHANLTVNMQLYTLQVLAEQPSGSGALSVNRLRNAYNAELHPDSR